MNNLISRIYGVQNKNYHQSLEFIFFVQFVIEDKISPYNEPTTVKWGGT